MSDQDHTVAQKQRSQGFDTHSLVLLQAQVTLVLVKSLAEYVVLSLGHCA